MKKKYIFLGLFGLVIGASIAVASAIAAKNQTKIDKQKFELNEKEKEIQMLRNKDDPTSNLEAEINLKNKKIEELEESLRTSQEKLNSLTQTSEELTTQINLLTTQKNELAEELKIEKDRSEEHNQFLKEKSKEIQIKQQNIDNLKEEKRLLEERLKQEESATTRNENSINSLKAQIEQKNNDINAKQREKEQLEQQLEQEKIRFIESQERIERLTNLVTTKDEEIINLTSEKNNLLHEKTNLQDNYNKLESQKQRLEADLQEKTSALNSKETELENYKTMHANTNSEYQNKQQELESEKLKREYLIQNNKLRIDYNDISNITWESAKESTNSINQNNFNFHLDQGFSGIYKSHHFDDESNSLILTYSIKKGDDGNPESESFEYRFPKEDFLSIPKDPETKKVMIEKITVYSPSVRHEQLFNNREIKITKEQARKWNISDGVYRVKFDDNLLQSKIYSGHITETEQGLTNRTVKIFGKLENTKHEDLNNIRYEMDLIFKAPYTQTGSWAMNGGVRTSNNMFAVDLNKSSDVKRNLISGLLNSGINKGWDNDSRHNKDQTNDKNEIVFKTKNDDYKIVDRIDVWFEKNANLNQKMILPQEIIIFSSDDGNTWTPVKYQSKVKIEDFGNVNNVTFTHSNKNQNYKSLTTNDRKRLTISFYPTKAKYWKYSWIPQQNKLSENSVEKEHAMVSFKDFNIRYLNIDLNSNLNETWEIKVEDDKRYLLEKARDEAIRIKRELTETKYKAIKRKLEYKINGALKSLRDNDSEHYEQVYEILNKEIEKTKLRKLDVDKYWEKELDEVAENMSINFKDKNWTSSSLTSNSNITFDSIDENNYQANLITAEKTVNNDNPGVMIYFTLTKNGNMKKYYRLIEKYNFIKNSEKFEVVGRTFYGNALRLKLHILDKNITLDKLKGDDWYPKNNPRVVYYLNKEYKINIKLYDNYNTLDQPNNNAKTIGLVANSWNANDRTVDIFIFRSEFGGIQAKNNEIFNPKKNGKYLVLTTESENKGNSDDMVRIRIKPESFYNTVENNEILDPKFNGVTPNTEEEQKNIEANLILKWINF
ncbi:hypothetical protein [Mycoplasma sp. OR1901]|uniref:hypothetical protein n=1 Tax=Mycoplasma sp. OR1901 TaxID=2742195 RepID=UPI001582C82C|nr:hypothetical protein [Mycoplasma sp. OR1901]QKT05660.1 hypothetical protein HTZ87_03050 [Mycoplasma sp. OR1901]